MLKIYSGFFAENGGHVTHEFNPGKCKLPEDFKDGDLLHLTKIGYYADSQGYEAWVFDGKQPNGTQYHQTLRYPTSGKPAELGRLIEANPENITALPPTLHPFMAGFFIAGPKS